MKVAITLAELKQLLDKKENILLIDVRNKEEYFEAHIPFAGNLPVEIIESGAFIPEPDKIIITACGKGGGRSERAANYLRENTNNKVYFLEGGTFGWFEKEHQ
jgi:rhodanese-related sulfurtransferase